MDVKKWELFDKQGVERSIFGGFASFFLIEKEKMKKLEDWNNEDCINLFLKNENFLDYVNILKYENIKGKDLMGISKDFMRDRLGILKEDL